MNEEQSIFDLIEKYHQGILSEEEKALVEKRMQSDAAFAEYLSLQGLTNKLVEAAGIDMLRERMSQDLAAIDQKTNRIKWSAGILAALLVLSGLVYFTNYFKKKNSPVRIEEKQTSPAREEKKDTTEISYRKKKNPQVVLKNNNATGNTDTIGRPAIFFPAKENFSEQQETTSDEKLPESKTELQNQSSKPCNLSFYLIVQSTCKGEREGTISVEKGTVTGGVKPYYFLSSSGEKSSTGNFSELGKGNYTITLYDAEGCSATQEAFISERNCASKKSYSFNPDYGEKWNAAPGEGSGNFVIYNRGGVIIFKGSFAENSPAEWYGTNAQGTTMEAGLYVCVLEYSEGKTETIEISVIR